MTLRQAILATLTYHDIFDYPLTLEEIHKFLITKASINSVEKELKKISPSLLSFSIHLLSFPAPHLSFPRRRESKPTTLYALPRRQNLFQIRKTRQGYSKSKLKRALLYSKILSFIPTVKLVAISGALAMQNSHKKDDIDLVIVTSSGTLWTTRFLANLLLFPFKRKPPSVILRSKTEESKNRSFTEFTLRLLCSARNDVEGFRMTKLVNNKACLNIFLDESDLQIHDQNLYTAHEICQLKSIFDREETYSRLIESNNWVSKFLPNWELNQSFVIASETSKRTKRSFGSIPALHLSFPRKRESIRGKLAEIHTKSRRVSTEFHSSNFIVRSLEILLKKFQLAYMKSKISTERIGEFQLFFHPKDTQQHVLSEYRKRLSKLRIK